MKIHGINGLTTGEIQAEISNGAKFVAYRYCISILILTFRRSSDIYFVRAGESPVVKGLAWTGLTLLLGWWGIPWGPIYTIGSLVTNFSGGKDLTQEIVSAMNVQELVS